MFVDELTFAAKAGDGGDGVVRWLQTKFNPRGGPAGGDGGKGGDIYVRAVADVNQLAKYTGKKEFVAARGGDGSSLRKHGKNGADVYIDIPCGSTVTDRGRNHTYELLTAGQTERILRGGRGGTGNLAFKSSINRSPTEATRGALGEAGEFTVVLAMVVDIGLVGLPNAGKSTLLNELTNAHAATGAYPFTTLEPHLGALGKLVIADIPGLIEGAATGKGLGHKFLRHVTRTKMILHCISAEVDNPALEYKVIRNELTSYNEGLEHKMEWIVLTKIDTNENRVSEIVANLQKETGKMVYPVSAHTGIGITELKEALLGLRH